MEAYRLVADGAMVFKDCLGVSRRPAEKPQASIGRDPFLSTLQVPLALIALHSTIKGSKPFPSSSAKQQRSPPSTSDNIAAEPVSGLLIAGGG